MLRCTWKLRTQAQLPCQTLLSAEHRLQPEHIDTPVLAYVLLAERVRHPQLLEGMPCIGLQPDACSSRAQLMPSLKHHGRNAYLSDAQQ